MNFFSRLLAILISIIAFFTGGNYNNIEFCVLSEVTTESETIEIEINNYSGKKIVFDNYFTLEKIDGEEVQKIHCIGEVTDVAISVNNAGTYTETLKIAELFGTTLEAGDYRLSKKINNGYVISVDFTVFED